MRKGPNLLYSKAFRTLSLSLLGETKLFNECTEKVE